MLVHFIYFSRMLSVERALSLHSYTDIPPHFPYGPQLFWIYTKGPREPIEFNRRCNVFELYTT